MASDFDWSGVFDDTGAVQEEAYNWDGVFPDSPGRYTVGEAVGDLWTSVTDVPTRFKGALARAIQGDSPDYSPNSITRRWIEQDNALTRQRMDELQARGDAGQDDTVLGLSPEDVLGVSQSLGFSVVSAGAGLAGAAAGMVTPVPGGAWAGGAAGSGVAAQRMQANQFLDDVVQAVDAAKRETQGEGLTDVERQRVIQTFVDDANRSGLWEALPEAAGNVLGFKIITAPVKSAIGKVFGHRLATRAVTKLSALYGTELTTETVTQQGQYNTEVAAGLQDGPARSWTSPEDMAASFGEVAPQTVLVTTLMAGAGSAAVKGAQALKRLGDSQDVDGALDAAAEHVRAAETQARAEAAAVEVASGASPEASGPGGPVAGTVAGLVSDGLDPLSGGVEGQDGADRGMPKAADTVPPDPIEGLDIDPETGEILGYEGAYAPEVYDGLSLGEQYLHDMTERARSVGVDESALNDALSALGPDPSYAEAATEIQRLIDEQHKQQSAAAAVTSAGETGVPEAGGTTEASQTEAPAGAESGALSLAAQGETTGGRLGAAPETPPPTPKETALAAPPLSGASSFRPTHVASDGTELQATGTPGLYVDADGVAVEDAYAAPIGMDTPDLATVIRESVRVDDPRWQRMKAEGADNKQLAAELARAFGVEGRKGPGWSARGGKRAYIGEGLPMVRLAGKRVPLKDVLTTAREALGVPLPSGGSRVEQAAVQAATHPESPQPEPSEAQKKAGNYKKGHVRLHGLEIAIENPAGTRRRPEWPPLKDHYGYIKGSVGKDKDHVDVFIGPDAEKESPGVYIVDQIDPDTGVFDEHKIMFGYPNIDSARRAYLRNYEKGWNGLGKITRVGLKRFKRWIGDAKATRKPYKWKYEGNDSDTENIIDTGRHVRGINKIDKRIDSLMRTLDCVRSA